MFVCFPVNYRWLTHYSSHVLCRRKLIFRDLPHNSMCLSAIRVWKDNILILTLRLFNLCFIFQSALGSSAVWKLSNWFLLTVICCPIYHWLEVSREVDISRARSASDIFTDDWPTTSHILGNKSLLSKTLFRFWHIRNKEKASVSFRSCQFSTITWTEIPPRSLTVIGAFTCIS